MTDVAAPLPQLDLVGGTTITVDTLDPAVPITQFVIHGWQEAGPPLPIVLEPPVAGFAGTEAPGLTR